MRHLRVGLRRAERPVLLVCREGLRDIQPLNLHLKRVARRALDVRKRESDSDRNKASA